MDFFIFEKIPFLIGLTVNTVQESSSTLVSKSCFKSLLFLKMIDVFRHICYFFNFVSDNDRHDKFARTDQHTSAIDEFSMVMEFEREEVRAKSGTRCRGIFKNKENKNAE